MLDLSKIAGMDLSKLPGVEQSGERCIRNIQEWLLHEVSSEETAVLPDDKLQRIMVGVGTFKVFNLDLSLPTRVCCFSVFLFSQTRVRIFQACNQLEIATYIEERAIQMRQDALQTLKAGLAGTATTHLLDVLEASFGVAEPEDEVPEIQPTPGEAEEENIPASTYVAKDDSASAPSTLGRAKCKAKGQVSGASKCKCTVPSKSGPVLIEDATPFFPTATLKANYLHIGVDPNYIGQREGSQFSKLVIYQCFYARRRRELGENPAECNKITQNKAQMSTHIRRFHLGNCIACFICPDKRWWSSLEWKKHMKEKHHDLPKDSWYIQDTATLEEDVTIKTEVDPKSI